MFAATAWQWVGAAVALPALGVCATWFTRTVGRWLGKALTATMAEAITQTVQPQLTAVAKRLTDSIETLRETGTAEHAVVAARLSALEERMTKVEARLPLET